MDRRRFLGVGAGLTAGLAGLGPVAGSAAAGPPRIRRYVKLGTTGLEVSDISFGSSRSSDPELVRHAADRGVTLFDSAESYRGGRAEEAIGEALRGRRDRFVITSKHKAWSGETRQSMMTAPRRVPSPASHRLGRHLLQPRGERRAAPPESRVAGVHGPGGPGRQDPLPRDIRPREQPRRVSRPCLDHDLADVILAAYNFAEDASFFDKMRARFHFVAPQTGLSRVLARAAGKGVGVLAMKTLMGARLNDMRPFETGGATFAQAAFRWVLSSASVDGVVISMTDAAAIDEYVAGSGGARLSADELGLLGRYAEGQGPRYCRPGCGACRESCPVGVEIAEVLRTRMYDVDYRDPLLARTGYAALGSAAGSGAAAACLSCDGTPCLGACPAGIPIAGFTRDAARRLGRAAPALA